MTIDDIDFAAMYRTHLARAKRTRKSPQAWDSRAATMAHTAMSSGYARAFVARMDLSDSESLLDVGCGPGTIGLMVADRMRSVIGLDYSPAMLEAMRSQASARGWTHVRPLLRAWEDDWSDIPPCDIVVASRSTLVDDIGAALAKLHAKARRRVYLTHLAGGHFLDPSIQEAVGRYVPPLPDYIYLVNILHRMGIHPRIDYITLESRLSGSTDFEDYASRVSWSIGGLTDQEMARLRAWHDRSTPAQRRGSPVRWAFLAWDKPARPSTDEQTPPPNGVRTL